MLEVEYFARVNNFPDYMISNFGNVLRNGQILNPFITNRGYCQIMANNGKIQRPFMVHRLVATYFVENPNKSEFNIIDHIDGNPGNNHYKNIRWCNASMNARNRKAVLSNTNIQGIHKHKNGSFEVSYYVDVYQRKRKYFKELDLAIKYREKMVDIYYSRVKASEP
jgi:hypothetical protein